MLDKPVAGKQRLAGGEVATGARFLNELEALSRALSLDPKNRRRSLPLPLPSSSSSDSNPNPNPKSKPQPQKDKKSSSSSSSSFWSWKSLKSLSHIRQRRFHCRFSLTVHSIDTLPSSLSDSTLCVHWKRTTDPASAAASTRPARAFHGAVEFDDTLAYNCSVYGTRSGSNNSAKYEPRQFLIWVTLAGASADLGRNLVDLTRLLPLTLEELEEEEKSTGRWSTSFRLSGRARGASLNVSFGFSLVGEGSSRQGTADRQGAETRVSDVLNGKRSGMIRSRDRSRSVEDVKVLHEVLPSSKADVLMLAGPEGPEYRKFNNEEKTGDLEGDSKVSSEVASQEEDEELSDVKACAFPESDKGNVRKDDDEPEFMVVEQGVEVAAKHHACETTSEKEGGVVINQKEVGAVIHELKDELSAQGDSGLKRDSLSVGDVVEEEEDLVSALTELSILDSEEMESPSPKAQELGNSDSKTSYKQGSMLSRSLSLDNTTNSVASEFLSMLGIEHSPFGLSSDSDPESPRERLWKQFEKESLAKGEGLFGVDTGSLATGDDTFGLDVGAEEAGWGDFTEDLDLSSIVLEAETELQKATQGIDSKLRAKMLEDAETEALMREWGLDEKSFQSSPPGSRCGFGSPIDLPPEEPLELPPLADGLGPFLQTKDGGFMRSMSPALFKNAKNNGSLIMQVSNPVVVPAEMGSGIMDILQGLASVGIEKLSMQAKKLMPLEDISGKTMQQMAWEAAPALEACDRHELLQQSDAEVRADVNNNATGKKKKKSRSSSAASSRSSETVSEYVSLENLAPLAMDKIEALSIEGLRIQSGMSDEDAPSNISPQYIGDISALKGKEGNNNRSLGLEGAAGLQLLDVKDGGDDVDGLMGLSITLDEWMRLDSGIVDEEDQNSERTSKILAAHHACSTEFISGGWKGDKKGGKRSGRRWGLLGNNFTVALMVQLRDPLRDYEPVGTPMLALIQVERVFVPPKPKIYGTVSEKGNSYQDDDDPEPKIELAAKEEKKEEEDVIPQFKITEVHVAGLKTEPDKKKLWGNSKQQQSGSRWLLATGMGKSNKHPFMKSKSLAKPSQVTTTVQPGDTLWSISSRVNGSGAKWKDLAALNPHIRNPNVILPNQTIRLR